MKNLNASLGLGILGLVIGALGSTYAWMKFIETGDRNRHLSIAELQVKTLENLRNSEIPTAIKIQDNSLNYSIINLGELLKQNPEDKEARVLLERAAKYRDAYPHRFRSDLLADDVAAAFSQLN